MLNVLTNYFVILFFLYEIPFIGVCLIITRLIVKRDNYFFYALLSWPLIILIINYISKVIDISFITNIGIYSYLVESNNFILGVAIVFIILKLLFNKAKLNFISGIKNTINKEEAKNYKIKKENDLKIKEKQLRAKNNEVIICQKCGASNIISDNETRCSYCRNLLSKKK